jgi:hypothetical protein
MTLPEAEFIANEFNKFTSVQSAEVVPTVGGDYSVLGNTHVLLSRELEGMVGRKRRREGSQKRAIRRLRDRGNFHRLSIGA